MIQIITEYNIEEMLKNPSKYVDDEEDIVLLKVFGVDPSNPVMLMLGLEVESGDGENDECYYFIEEDNDVSIYHHCSEGKLRETYEKLLEKLRKESE